jgi:hypothetical protein
MKIYRIYGNRIQNNPANEPSFIRRIAANSTIEAVLRALYSDDPSIGTIFAADSLFAVEGEFS